MLASVQRATTSSKATTSNVTASGFPITTAASTTTAASKTTTAKTTASQHTAPALRFATKAVAEGASSGPTSTAVWTDIQKLLERLTSSTGVLTFRRRGGSEASSATFDVRLDLLAARASRTESWFFIKDAGPYLFPIRSCNSSHGKAGALRCILLHVEEKQCVLLRHAYHQSIARMYLSTPLTVRCAV